MHKAQLNIATNCGILRRATGLMVFIILFLVACNDGHDGKLSADYETQLSDLVTYTGLDNAGHATFRLEGRDDEPGVDLFTNVGKPQKVDLHSRVLMRYSINHKDPAGAYWNIDALSLTRIMSDSLRVNVNPIDTYSMRPIRLTSAWRTGEFINLHGQVEYTGKNRYLYMLVDSDTRMNDTVEAYLVHDLLDTPEDSVYYWREFYLSVNVGVLKSDKYPCHLLRLHINDDNNPKVTFRDFKIK